VIAFQIPINLNVSFLGSSCNSNPKIFQVLNKEDEAEGTLQEYARHVEFLEYFYLEVCSEDFAVETKD
jgi:hypothetical protein